MNVFAVICIYLVVHSSEAISSETESICFHSSQAVSSSEPQVVRGPVGKAGPIGRTGPPGEPGRDAVCNYNKTELEEIKIKIENLESKSF